jgi:hypothetical protein
MPSRDRLCVKPGRSFGPRGKDEAVAARVRGSAVQRLKALTSDAGGPEGGKPSTRARRHVLRRQVKGLVENNRADPRARNSLSCHMAKAMTTMAGSLRIRRLDGCAREGCDRERCGADIAPASKGREVMK